MEWVTCAVCGADDSEPLLIRADRLSGEHFQFRECRRCGLLYLNPRPSMDEIAAFYPDRYEPYRADLPADWLTARRTQGAQVIKRRFVEAFRTGGRLLDVGCATGDFLARMAVRDWDVQGVETSPLAARVARKRHGVPVFVGQLGDMDFSNGSFDVITLWDVLEHLHNPLADLRRIHRLLVAGGHVILSIPNLQSWDRILFGSAWIGWDAPRHLHMFPPKPLERMLSSAGFRIIARRCILGGIGAFILSYQFWLASTAPKSCLQVLRAPSPLLPVLLWPYKELAYRFGRGPIETIACIKT